MVSPQSKLTNQPDVPQKQRVPENASNANHNTEKTGSILNEEKPIERTQPVSHNLGPPPPGHQMQSPMQNAGMQVGMYDAMFNSNGPNMGTGMVDGMLVGGIVGQRIDQARNHAYWKQIQQEYLAGNESAVINPGVARTPREIRREERRRKRWERRS